MYKYIHTWIYIHIIHVRKHTHIHIYTHTNTKCTYERTQARLERRRDSERKYTPVLYICQWLFLQNVIQVQPHGGKNPIVLYQEMWLQVFRDVSLQPTAATMQRFNWSGPPHGGGQGMSWLGMRLARRWTCVFLWIAIVFRSSVRGTWPVESLHGGCSRLQSAAGWNDGTLATTFPGTIQWGFYHHVAALESRSGKIATGISCEYMRCISSHPLWAQQILWVQQIVGVQQIVWVISNVPKGIL